MELLLTMCFSWKLRLKLQFGVILMQCDNSNNNLYVYGNQIIRTFQFVEDNFDDEGLELESWIPEDWTPNPEFIAKLKKPQLRGLAKRINRLWKDLSRKIKEDVKEDPSLYSIIYVPNGFVVPGGKN